MKEFKFPSCLVHIMFITDLLKNRIAQSIQSIRSNDVSLATGPLLEQPLDHFDVFMVGHKNYTKFAKTLS